jgi:hypothetical protein
MKKVMKKVVIYVEGGNVQSVMTDSPAEIEVELFDVDNLKEEGKHGYQIDKKWKKITKGMEVIL